MTDNKRTWYRVTEFFSNTHFYSNCFSTLAEAKQELENEKARLLKLGAYQNCYLYIEKLEEGGEWEEL